MERYDLVAIALSQFVHDGGSIHMLIFHTGNIYNDRNPLLGAEIKASSCSHFHSGLTIDNDNSRIRNT